MNKSFDDHLIDMYNMFKKEKEDTLMFSINGPAGCGKNYHVKSFSDKLSKITNKRVICQELHLPLCDQFSLKNTLKNLDSDHNTIIILLLSEIEGTSPQVLNKVKEFINNKRPYNLITVITTNDINYNFSEINENILCFRIG